LAINAVLAAVFTVILNAAGVAHGQDETNTEDYFADEGDARVEKRREMIDPGSPLRL